MSRLAAFLKCDARTEDPRLVLGSLLAAAENDAQAHVVTRIRVLVATELCGAGGPTSSGLTPDAPSHLSPDYVKHLPERAASWPTMRSSVGRPLLPKLSWSLLWRQPRLSPTSPSILAHQS